MWKVRILILNSIMKIKHHNENLKKKKKANMLKGNFLTIKGSSSNFATINGRQINGLILS